MRSSSASNAEDLNGRHLWKVSVDSGKVSRLTSGSTIEDSPDVTGEGHIVAYQAGTRQTLEPVYFDANGKGHVLAPPLPPTFPLKVLVEPQNVSIQSPDGMQVHGQLFVPTGAAAAARHPAVVFFHGGPTRQMFAAWSPMDAYSYMYGFNQYLANKGYVVLSVNYRGGAGYGLKFREAPGFGAGGASEYQDILDSRSVSSSPQRRRFAAHWSLWWQLRRFDDGSRIMRARRIYSRREWTTLV